MALNVSTQLYTNNFSNETVEIVSNSRHFLLLFVVIIPLFTVAGNTLVVLAVITDRGLRTATNYLLLSLALADFMVGCLVMPFAIYLAIEGLEWRLSETACKIFIVSDVTLSTCSIGHLVVISIDRFFAVVKHVEYQTVQHRKRIMFFIAAVWTFSLALGFPVGLGLKSHHPELGQHHCGIENAYYMLYGSIFAFYIPTSIMVVMYGIIFHQLRKRLLTVKFQEKFAASMFNGIRGITATGEAQEVHSDEDVNKNIAWTGPLVKALEDTVAQRQQDMQDNDDVACYEDVKELTTIINQIETGSIQYKQSITRRSMKEKSSVVSRRSRASLRSAHPFGTPIVGREITEIRSMVTYDLPTVTEADTSSDKELSPDNSTVNKMKQPSIRSTKFAAAQTSIRRWSEHIFVRQMTARKLIGLKGRACELLMKLRSRQGLALRKETRATKLVAAVLVLFMFCWLGFFTLNVVKASFFLNSSKNWSDSMENLFIVFTWLGYLNSGLNPIVYSLFNRRFRLAYLRLICCSTGQTPQRQFANTVQMKAQSQRRTESFKPVRKQGLSLHTLRTRMKGLNSQQC